MNMRHGPLLGVLVAVVLSAVPAAAQDDAIEVSLRHKPFQKWEWVLPSEQWSSVRGMIPVAHAEGQGFVVKQDGNKLMIDQTGNGRTTHDVKGVGGFALFRARDAEGKPLMYGARFRKAGNGWEWAAGGAMLGKIKGQPIALFDQNNNGRYDDLGEDAYIIGRTRGAAFLSRVINVRGDLFEIEVAADGSSVKATPFTGETGELNLVEGFRGRGRLNSAVVSSADGQYSFQLSDAKRGLDVPVGEYAITAGQAQSGAETVMIRQGQMQPLAVEKDAEVEVTWGAKLEIEFDYTLANGNLTVEPSALRWYGAAGEEYYGWTPDAKSPKILIIDAENGRLVGEGRFGGC